MVRVEGTITSCVTYFQTCDTFFLIHRSSMESPCEQQLRTSVRARCSVKKSGRRCQSWTCRRPGRTRFGGAEELLAETRTCQRRQARKHNGNTISTDADTTGDDLKAQREHTHQVNCVVRSGTTCIECKEWLEVEGSSEYETELLITQVCELDLAEGYSHESGIVT